MTQNQWYLLVGHIRPFSHSGTTVHSDSGVYSTSSKLPNGVYGEYKFTPDTTLIGHRAFLYYSTDVTAEIELFQPRIDLLDGTEPTIAQLQTNCGSIITDLSSTSNGLAVRRYPPVVTDGNTKCFDFSSNVGLNASTALMGFSFINPIPTTGSFTFDAWVKNVPAVVGQSMLFTNTGNADGYRLGVGADGVYYLIGPTYLEGTIAWTGVFTNTVWNHVTVVFDRLGTTTANIPKVLVYLNGTLNNSATINASQTAFSTGNDIAYMSGALPSTGFTFPTYSGKLGKFSVYKRALLPDEIKQNFYSNRGRYAV